MTIKLPATIMFNVKGLNKLGPHLNMCCTNYYDFEPRSTYKNWLLTTNLHTGIYFIHKPCLTASLVGDNRYFYVPIDDLCKWLNEALITVIEEGTND